MHPMGSKRAPGGHRLGPFVLVMREGEVEAAAMDLEALAEQVERHDHTLGVPARSARPEGRVRRRLAGLGLLPEGEVEWRALRLVDIDAGTRAQRVERLMGEQSVSGHR